MTGYGVVDGVPYINGKPATPKDVMKEMAEVLAPWACPECGANLAVDGLICLNGCHLSLDSQRRFREQLVAAAARVEARDKAKEGGE